MKLVFSTLKKTLFWSYERGSWQYDILCVLILAFIFFGPNSVFHNHRSSQADETDSRPLIIERDEIGEVNPARLNEDVTSYLSKKYGHELKISRVEPKWDDKGNITGYIAWEE